MKDLWKLLPILALVFVAACGDDHDDEDHEHEHGDEPEYCLHMEDGPANAVDVSASGVDYEHQRIDLTLGADGGTFDIAVDEAGDYTLALSANTSVAITDGDGNAVTPEASDVSEQCEGAVQVTHTVEFDIATYTLVIGPSEG